MSDMLAIRPANADDLAEIDALLARTYPALLKADYPPSVLVTAIPLISKANPRLIATGTYFVACDRDGKILAAGGWTGRAPDASAPMSGVGHIRHVVTDNRYLRRGIGRALMAHIFQTARDGGISTLECLSTRTAEQFYAACGFDRIGPITVSLAPGIDFPAVHMQRSIRNET